MASALAKKREERELQKLKDLLRLPGNKKCFDCAAKSPFFVNVSVQTFICVRCSGLVREVGHRVKSISASKFTEPEIISLQYWGNDVAKSIWLHNYNTSLPDPETDDEVRLFMRQKYFEHKWLNRELLVKHTDEVREKIRTAFIEVEKKAKSEGRMSIEAQQTKSMPRLGVSRADPAFSVELPRLEGPTPSPTKQRPASIPAPLPRPSTDSSSCSTPLTSPVPSITKTEHRTSSVFDDLGALMAELPVKQPVYTGGILTPQSPTKQNMHRLSSSMTSSTISGHDPYAALRNLVNPSEPPPKSDMYCNSRPLSHSSTMSDLATFSSSPRSPTYSQTQHSRNISAPNADIFRDLDPLRRTK